jgi:hypothetical protein
MPDPRGIIETFCVAREPIPFNAGVVADYAGISVDEADELIEWALQIGIASTPAQTFRPPEGRGKITVVGNHKAALAHLNKRKKEQAQDGG